MEGAIVHAALLVCLARFEIAFAKQLDGLVSAQKGATQHPAYPEVQSDRKVSGESVGRN